MGLGKTYSTKYLVDSNNNTGAVGEVLVSTATGINWANGSDIVGGPYLPLAGGTMTGTGNINTPDQFKLRFGAGNDLQIYHQGGTSGSYIDNYSGNMRFNNYGNDTDIVFNNDDGAGGATTYLQLDGSTGAVVLNHYGSTKLSTTSTGVEVTGKITNLTAGTGNLDAVNVQQLNDATTGALIFKGTWSAALTTTSTTSAAVSSSTTVVISSPNAGISVGATVTGAALPAGITVTAIAADEVTLTISSAQSITSGATLTFTTVGGIPDLSQTARKVTGDYYICETAGVATPNGTGTTPDDWAVGDWVAFSDLATDAWQKIDNSSVLSGAGTGGTVPVWAGSGTSVTLADAPITVSGNNATFAGDITLLDDLNFATNGFADIKNTGTGAMRFKPSSQTLALSLSGADATFAGNIDVNGTGNNTFIGNIAMDNAAPILLANSSNNASGLRINVTGIADSTNNLLRVQRAGTTLFDIRGNGNIINTGTVTAPTFIGDLNGTINTATTGATQTAGDNSTLIATTAYADAAAAAGGGNFLPLAGGTLTGNLVIESALLSNQENTDVDTGTETVASVLKATYTAAFFDFVIKNGTNLRAGTVFACHDGTNVVYTETSTNDLGDTSDVTLSVDISGTDMRLRATATSDDWSVKSLIRAI